MVRVQVFLAALCGAALVLSGGCGKRPVANLESEPALECRVSPVSEKTLDAPVTFALLDPVDLSRAPWASHASDRLVFGHLYETLVTIDCEGEVRPCVAESWTSANEGMVWTFELRRDARFWDGSPVTAGDVAASWRDALTLGTIIDSVSAVSDRSLTVRLRRPCPQLPRVVSAFVYAVTKPSGDSRWPTGSGPYRVGSVDIEAYPEARRSITVYPAFGLSGPVIRFAEMSADRVRDGLESTIDAVVTADPAVIEYAAARAQFSAVALPWDRTYVLLSTSRVRAVGAGRPVPTVTPGVLDGLARDAIRGDARGYRAPSWWDDLTDCLQSTATSRGVQSGPLVPSVAEGAFASSLIRHIVYDASDPAARGVAERISALSAADTARSVEARAFARAVPDLCERTQISTAADFSREELERSLRRGDQWAYVVSLPREPSDPCYEERALMERAPWLGGAGRVLADVLIPLVDARSHLIVRKDAVELEIDGNGTVFVIPRNTEAEKTRGGSP